MRRIAHDLRVTSKLEVTVVWVIFGSQLVVACRCESGPGRSITDDLGK